MTGGLTLDTVVRVNPETAVQRVGGRYMAATPDDRLHTFEAPDGSVSEVGERIIELIDGARTLGGIIDGSPGGAGGTIPAWPGGIG